MAKTRYDVTWGRRDSMATQRQSFDDRAMADDYARILEDRHPDYAVTVEPSRDLVGRRARSDERPGARTALRSPGFGNVEYDEPIRVHAHPHAKPSHHRGPCSPACRHGDAEHSHRVRRSE